MRTSRDVMNNHVYEYDEIVIGSNLNAVIYSYLNSKPIIMNGDKAPKFFEFFPYDMDLEKLSANNKKVTLHGFNENRIVGAPKFDVWQKLVYANSLSGLNFLSDKVESIRVDDNVLRVTTKNFRLVRVKFNKLRVFDDDCVVGLPEPTILTKNYRVLDWVDVRSGMLHKYDYLRSSVDFVKDIYFYPSKSIDGNTNKKELVIVSYLSEEQLKDFDFSDTVAKFKTLKLMKRAGIRGARNGRDQKNPDKFKYYSLKIRPTKREVTKKFMHKYKDEENIIFDPRTEEEVIMQENARINDYSQKLVQEML